ncbi:hypothetical protein L596_023919 [Steinernema carpocapsae]|uniref:Uncharacterized protein n=1 Tax=Steinernema carpocapsae TaxID=34508 RepID=A0A4U5MF57_STECR|nr:hypothetical protein L596_023919 [Steinernema carpocapsae]
MASDLTKMLMEHDETHKELMQKNGVKSRLSSAKGRYAREVILHRLTNVADLWLAYQELLKTIACERTRALNYFIVEMISNPLEAKGEQLEAIVEKYDREVDGIEKTVAEMDKRAVRLWTNFRKHNTSGVSQCCIKDASDYGFLYKKYTDLYVEAMYSADTCLPLNICSEKTSQEFARWPFMITIFLIVFLVSLFNSKARSEDPRDADDELNPDDPRASGNLNSVTIPGFVFRSTDPMTSTELLHSAKETDPPPAYTPPVQHSSASPPPYSSIVRTHNAVVDC